jgi:hypothetical protein
MKSLIVKYKGRIVYWAIWLCIALIGASRESEHFYLRGDLERYREYAFGAYVIVGGAIYLTVQV